MLLVIAMIDADSLMHPTLLFYSGTHLSVSNAKWPHPLFVNETGFPLSRKFPFSSKLSVCIERSDYNPLKNQNTKQ